MSACIDIALATTGAQLDAYHELLLICREQAARKDHKGNRWADHTSGTVMLTAEGRTYLTLKRADTSVGIHGLTASDLRSLAAACIAIADMSEAQP
jgi:hypothetical protein